MSSSTEAHCFRCGYDLRGLADDQPCPECGLLAERSRRVTDSLRDARPAWLRSLSIGVWLILLSLLLSGLSAWIGQDVVEYIDSQTDLVSWLTRMASSRLFYSQILGLLESTGYIVASLMGFMGLWLLTRPEGFEPADRQDRRRRIAIRLIGSILLLVKGYEVLIALMNDFDWYRWKLNRTTEESVIAAFCLILAIMIFAQFRNLARRAASRHLEEHCTIVGLGTAGAIGVGYLAYLLFYGATWGGSLDNWMSRSIGWLGVLCLVATSAVLFWLWCIYLMIRFAISFGRASKEARRAWRAADRAINIS